MHPNLSDGEDIQLFLDRLKVAKASFESAIQCVDAAMQARFANGVFCRDANFDSQCTALISSAIYIARTASALIEKR